MIKNFKLVSWTRRLVASYRTNVYPTEVAVREDWLIKNANILFLMIVGR